MSPDPDSRESGRALAERLNVARRRLWLTARRRLADLRPAPPICHDLQSWTASHAGAERRVLDPPFTISRELPLTVEPVVHPSFAEQAHVDVPERALVKIPRARIRGEVGLLILPTGEFVGETVALTPNGREELLRGEEAYSAPLPKRAEPMRGNYYAVLGLGVNHYYHWSHDLVMRMRGIAPLLPTDTQLIVPEHLQQFQVETLGLLGLDHHPRVPFPPRAFWELEHLYVVTPLLKAQIDSEAPYRWFRERAMDRYGITPTRPTRRFYLTRRHDRHWR